MTAREDDAPAPLNWDACDSTAVLRALQATPEGLDHAEAAGRLARHGPNPPTQAAKRGGDGAWVEQESQHGRGCFADWPAIPCTPRSHCCCSPLPCSARSRCASSSGCDEELRRGLEFRFQWLDANKDGNIQPRLAWGVPILR